MAFLSPCGHAVIYIFRILTCNITVYFAHVSDVLTIPVYLLIDGCALSVAIWEHNRIITAVAMTTWVLNLAACIHCVSVSRRTWIQLLN